MQLADRIENVERRLQDACLRSGRMRADIQVIAVTKYVETAVAQDVLRAGYVHLGENRWQHAEEKWRAISSDPALESDEANHRRQAVWHFIGSLQTNKVKDVVGKFSYIHSLDRESLASALDKRAAQLDITVPCFIQVNVSGEEAKQGLAPEQLPAFVAGMRQFPNLAVAGLMTMAPFEAEPEQTRPVFRGLRELRDDLNKQAILPNPILGLSMGMSNDFEVAVEEGATWLRLGTVLVGKKEEKS
ncbi:YggS family pyridoxal phosphate-dependent enzyme [Paenibacillaceae bacterium]|nr:YggS family pyridoxal phosphate-dependent enzyme [Paenibacillaceae bacterium]